MALKSTDPRKAGENEIHSDRFERLVDDAWSTRHGDDSETMRADRTASQGSPSDPSAHAYHAADGTYYPFAELKQLISD